MSFPLDRPRRLRTTPAMRRLAAETRLHPADFVLPLFVKETVSDPTPIASMPGVLQHTLGSVRKAAAEAVAEGLGGLMLFAIPAEKDARGSAGLAPDGILQRVIAEVRDEVGDDIVIMSDLCLDEFTDHGHCGVIRDDGTVDNDATLELYAEMGIRQAEAGAHMVAPSGMMDGQVAVIRRALDEAGRQDTSILAYSAKYASAFFGPFRDAVESSLKGDRSAYQENPANTRESLREVRLDVEEGADMIMVKPALSYLDIVRQVADMVEVPVVAYQVSGEYAMVEAAAANGWLDRERTIMETLTSVRRAGATSVLTYWAVEAARML
ncbi:porphobilinogen synthase [Catenulispora pinisilvae]|uniref:porphobilinogen synthase n=1 Tax=Catenulispora pinisilvae TaxID=2705253 RepID=UPI00189270A3|nr:porphobilinogen synthase [Catenulispora pinisilvae]